MRFGILDLRMIIMKLYLQIK